MKQPIPCPSKGFFKIDNLFGELITEAQRQIARKHLGVSDEYTLFWGNIKGYIEDQKDFIEKLKELIKEYGGELTEITNQAVADVNARLDMLLNEVDSILIQAINDFKIQSVEEIEAIKIEFKGLMADWEKEVTALIQQWDDLNLLDYPYTNPKDPTIQTVGDALNKLGLGVAKVDTLEELYSFSARQGDLVYVLENDVTYKYTRNGWYAMEQALVVSGAEPVNKSVVWYEPASEFAVNQEGNLTSLRSSIKTLEEQMAQVIKLINYGIIAGDSSVGARTIMYNSDTPINPNTGEIEPIEPNKTELLYTVPNISVKYDTIENFGKNKRNLIDGELIWITDKNSLYIYLNNSFIPISNGGSGGVVTPENDMTQEDIEKLYFNHLGLTNKNNDQYRLEVNENGNITVYNTYNYDGIIGTALTYGSYISDYLKINSLFIGGENTNLDEFTACSHNYVELANADNKDINLYGIYLLYRKPGSTSWESIGLKGTIKAGSTFLIRGARCSYKSNVTLDVDDYDMQWYDSKGNLISFNEGGGCFYLVCSNEGLFNNTVGWVSLKDLGSFDPYISTGSPVGYIDLVGLRLPKSTYTVHSEGGSPISINQSEDAKKCIFVRSFPLDPCSQAQKAHNAKKSSALWTYINMDKVSEEGFPYYSMENKHLYTPKSSRQNKTIYGTRSTFTKDKPNMVNITFGIQATDNGNGATRCFNWVSVGYYDEYIEYKKSTDTWNNALTKKSISADNYITEYPDDSNVEQFINIYNRIKWLSTNKTMVTTHKVILRNLTQGTYNYRVRRVDDPTYVSGEYTFTVRTDSMVNKGFNYVHTTDQQAFNYYEYQAWTKAAYAINKNHSDIQFTLNTGDCTQNGNRESEWLDYYEGRRFLRDKEEMYVIGNNDLCGIIPYELGDGTAKTYKINHKNIQYYFTFELDSNNPAIFTYKDASIDLNKIGDVLSYDSTSFTYYMPSLYSFNYGNYHFIGINSEFADNTSKIYYNDDSKTEIIRSHAYYNMYKWIKRDLERYPNKNYVAFMHELPFCITKGGANDIAEAREATNGSKLNYDFTSGISKNIETDTEIYTGGCNFSELFQNNNIKLALGGHKHTYSLSYPIIENVVYTANSRTVSANNPIEDNTIGVVYAMSQATGYKLVSNKELPGKNISWLKKYFPMSNGSASNSQYYPMYSLISTQGNTTTLESYAVFNIFQEKTAFNINNQASEFLRTNSRPINFASGSNSEYKITINY